MLLFGHRFITSKPFYHIFDLESIEHTPPSSTLYVEFCETNLDIIGHLSLNAIPFALSVQTINELIYGENFGASYLVVDQKLAKTAQSIAENYLFDAKILTHITKDETIEEMALLGIDGVIFPEAIIKINA
jgi:hypothetical protein